MVFYVTLCITVASDRVERVLILSEKFIRRRMRSVNQTKDSVSTMRCKIIKFLNLVKIIAAGKFV